jgi:hypothetical protein
MPRAVVLNTYSKASTTGGTFADTLTANSLDSASIPNLPSGQGKIVRAWGIDSASVAEVAITDTRFESIHDQQFGLRYNIPATAFGGAGAPAAFPLIEPPAAVPVYSGDTLTFSVTSTAGDCVIVSTLSEYADLPGVAALFARWEQVQSLRRTQLNARCAPVASGTKGAYGTARAINADDTRWTADRYYAILGFTVQIPVTTVSFRGYMWGNVRFGAPAGSPFLTTDNFFIDLSQRFNEALIPVFNGSDVGNVLLEVADSAASTSPKVDVIAIECSANPAVGA